MEWNEMGWPMCCVRDGQVKEHATFIAIIFLLLIFFRRLQSLVVLSIRMYVSLQCLVIHTPATISPEQMGVSVLTLYSTLTMYSVFVRKIKPPFPIFLTCFKNVGSNLFQCYCCFSDSDSYFIICDMYTIVSQPSSQFATPDAYTGHCIQ